MAKLVKYIREDSGISRVTLDDGKTYFTKNGKHDCGKQWTPMLEVVDTKKIPLHKYDFNEVIVVNGELLLVDHGHQLGSVDIDMLCESNGECINEFRLLSDEYKNVTVGMEYQVLDGQLIGTYNGCNGYQEITEIVDTNYLV